MGHGLSPGWDRVPGRSDCVVLLATTNVLTRSWCARLRTRPGLPHARRAAHARRCLLELWEAHRLGVPVIVMPIQGRGFDNEDAREQIVNLENRLPESAQELISHHLASTLPTYYSDLWP